MDESSIRILAPARRSAHGPAIDHLLVLMLIFIAVIFIAWLAFFLYCLVKFRERADHRSQSTRWPRAAFVKYAELSIILIELLLLFGVSTPIWWKYKQTRR